MRKGYSKNTQFLRKISYDCFLGRVWNKIGLLFLQHLVPLATDNASEIKDLAKNYMAYGVSLPSTGLDLLVKGIQLLVSGLLVNRARLELLCPGL